MSTTETTERRYGGLKAGEASLPLIKMEIAGTITGLLQRTRVCQTFVNDHTVPLEAIYTHPLPPRASVHGFRMVIGGRVVEGVVQERRAARQAYAEAISQGRRAALMEEERSDIFTTTVGNIAPGEQVSITFELSGPLEFLESTASLRFPLVVPEVYVSGNALGGGDVGDGTAADTDSVPDASRITPPRLAHGADNPVNLKLSFDIDPAGLELEQVDSLCHFAKCRQKADGTHVISLLPGVERMDRDFVVRLRLKEGSLQTTLVHDPESGTFALTVVPPLGTSQRPAPRDLVIVLDRSGSMQGWSMTAARRAASRIVESLTPQDRFALIAFDDRVEMLDPHLVPADLRNQQRAQEFLASVDSRGGTEARPAIERALQALKGESASDKTVLFITDGDVGNDSELVVRSAAGVRVSTVGIGHNSRAGVLESMAKISGGLCSLIPEESTLEESLRKLHQRLGRPHWMGISIKGMDSAQQAPRYWDIWEGVPATFFGRANWLGEKVTVEGWMAAAGHYSQSVNVNRRDDLVIHRSWARARLLDLEDLWTIGKASQHELVTLSEQAQVLCRFTAFTAIDVTEVVANHQEMKTVVQPVEPTLGGFMAQEDHAPASLDFFGDLLDAQPARSPGAPVFSAAAPPLLGDDFLGCAAPEPFMDADCFGSDNDMFSIEDRDVFDECSDLELEEGGARGALDFHAPPKLESLWEEPPGPAQRQDSLKARRAQAPAPSLSQERAEAARESAPLKKLRASGSSKSIWSTLLDLLRQLIEALAERKLSILEQMMEKLGDHCRTTPAGSAQARTGKEVMSLLVDLRQTLEDGHEETSQVEALRAVLESLE